jgi:RNA polymerase sigma factor (sigma-70 family)
MAALTSLVTGGTVVPDASHHETAACDLFEVYGPRLCTMMIRSGADANTAAQLAHEAVLAVERKVGTDQYNNAALSTLMFTVARDLRTVHLHKSLNWHCPSDRTPAVSEVTAPIDHGRTQMQAAISDLSSGQRQIVELAYLEGLSNSQIAERLCLPVSYVKSNMRLTSEKAREAFADLS